MKKHWPVILFLVLYFLITSYKLISHPTPFYDWDESIYAQVGREMVRQHSLVPLWQGQYWLDKPPLTPLVYGIVETFTPAAPEISTREFTLILSIAVLALTYVFYYRLVKNTAIPLLTVIITAFTPVFLQRAQVLNVDVFLMLGWIGYLVFYDNFWLSLLFLATGVLSKSLLGLYPLIGMLAVETIQLYLKKIKTNDYKKRLTSMLVQLIVLSFWYLTMLAVFRFAFIKNQFLEAMFKRVTSSIESHFGKRTFYITTLFDQIKIFFILSVIGLVMVIRENLSVKNWRQLVLLLFFVPWFLFLNVTKTKIAWYIYPVIPQFAFLGVYLLIYFKKFRMITILITIVISLVILNQAFRQDNFLTTYYSSYDQYYRLAVYAGKNCGQLEVLVDPATRQTYDTLNRMNLTISTTKWWGNHPAIVYYSGKKVDFVYDKNYFIGALNTFNQNECVVINNQDSRIMTGHRYVLKNKFQEMDLYAQ